MLNPLETLKSHAKFKEELSDDLSIIANCVTQFLNDFIFKVNSDGSALSKSYVPFVNCISRYKHYGFKEENEVRLVALPTVIDQTLINMANSDGHIFKPEKERKYRNQNGQRIPYIEIFDSPDIDLPINKIIVGPHKDKETHAATLRVMLRKTNIEITCSDIPYIGL